ncbi:MAG: zinc ribbon domain-containing protein [Vicinamibacterales bacterium]
MSHHNRHVSSGRKTMFYAGTGMIALGLLLFALSLIWLIAGGLRAQIPAPFPHPNMSIDARPFPWGLLPGFVGVPLVGVGGFLRRLGSRGLAGSGVILDPEQARKDLEPWSRMGGGMIEDALSEVDTLRSRSDRAEDAGTPEVKVRCQSCRALNEEGAKFCNQCGAAM